MAMKRVLDPNPINYLSIKTSRSYARFDTPRTDIKEDYGNETGTGSELD